MVLAQFERQEKSIVFFICQSINGTVDLFNAIAHLSFGRLHAHIHTDAVVQSKPTFFSLPRYSRNQHENLLFNRNLCMHCARYFSPTIANRELHFYCAMNSFLCIPVPIDNGLEIVFHRQRAILYRNFLFLDKSIEERKEN